MGNERMHFLGFLQVLLDDNSLDVTMGDADKIMEETIKRIRELDKARRGFQRETVKMDSKGRISIPMSMRVKKGWGKGDLLEVTYDPNYKGVIVK